MRRRRAWKGERSPITSSRRSSGSCSDEVGGVVGLHAREQRGDLLVAAVLDELELVAVLELLEDVGLELGVGGDRGDDLLALVVRRRLDEVGDLRRVELRELRVRHAQADGRDVAGERLDRGPVEEAAAASTALGERARQHAPDAGPRRLTSTPTTRYQPSSRASSISFARTSRAPSTLISCRSRTSFFSSTSCGPPLEVLEVELLGDQRHEAGRDLDDLLRGDEDRAARDGRDDAGDRRIVLVAEADDQVVDAAEPLAAASRSSPPTTSERWKTVGVAAATTVALLHHSHRFQRKKPSMPMTVTSMKPIEATKAAHELKPGKWTFIPKKPVMNESGVSTTRKIVRT